MKVYLAGPHMDDQFRLAAISGLAVDRSIEPFDPIAARDFRGKEINNESEIVDGDIADIVACDLVFGNYSVPGWGTGMETWFAYSLQRPIVAYVEPGARVSPWIAKVAGGYDWVYRSVDDGVRAVLAAAGLLKRLVR